MPPLNPLPALGEEQCLCLSLDTHPYTARPLHHGRKRKTRKRLSAEQLSHQQLATHNQTVEQVLEAQQQMDDEWDSTQLKWQAEQEAALQTIEPDQRERYVASLQQQQAWQQAALEASEEPKPHFSITVIGHVASGKPATKNRRLHKLHGNDTRVRDQGGDTCATDQGEEATTQLQQSSLFHTGVLDKLFAQSESSFETPYYCCTVVAASSPCDVLQAASAGLFEADCAVLVVDASPGCFEAGICRGGQTREVARLAYSRGIRQLIVVVDKMDSVQWAQDRFEVSKKVLRAHFNTYGYAPDKVHFVPISGEYGDNLAERSPHTASWYGGPTLVEALDLIVPQHPTHRVWAPPYEPKIDPEGVIKTWLRPGLPALALKNSACAQASSSSEAQVWSLCQLLWAMVTSLLNPFGNSTLAQVVRGLARPT